MTECFKRKTFLPESASLEELWAKRYGRDDQPVRHPDLNGVLETMLAHKTYRSYTADPLPEGALELAMAAAQSAPSSSNMQAWDVIAIADPERKARINALSSNQKQIANAPVLLVWIGNLSRLRQVSAQHGLPGASLDYFESFVMCAVDAALAAQNALVALESMGLSTCYIGALRNHPEEVARELNLPPESFPVFGMTVGVPDPTAGVDVKPRLPQTAVFHREVYAPMPQEVLDRFDATYREFQASQSMKPTGWGLTTADKLVGPEVMRNREKLREALVALGFRMA